jgi:hypothetical protein
MHGQWIQSSLDKAKKIMEWQLILNPFIVNKKDTEKLKGVLAIECDENSPQHNQVESMVKIIDDANCIILDGTERVTTIVRRLRSFARLDHQIYGYGPGHSP